MYYGHGSWVVLLVLIVPIALRALSSQRRRGGRVGPPAPPSFFTDGNHRGPGRADVPAAAVPVSKDPTHGGTGAGWFTDPFVRHDQRYWSGTEWTEHVTDHGIPGTDPPPQRPAPPDAIGGGPVHPA